MDPHVGLCVLNRMTVRAGRRGSWLLHETGEAVWGSSNGEWFELLNLDFGEEIEMNRGSLVSRSSSSTIGSNGELFLVSGRDARCFSALGRPACAF